MKLLSFHENSVFLSCQRDPCQNLFVNILIARNCIIPSFSFKNLSGVTHRTQMDGSPVYIISYHTSLRLLCCFISGYALETRSLHGVGLSFVHDTRVLHLIIRFTPTHAHITSSIVFDFALDIQRCAFSDLVSLTNRIYSSLASPLILRRLAPSSLASPTNRINHRLLDIRF